MRILTILTICLLAGCQQIGNPIRLLKAQPSPADAALATVQADIKQLGTDVQVLHDAVNVAPPAPPAPTDSPDGTIIQPGSGTVVDLNGDKWTLAADATIDKNGVGAFQGWQSHELVYHNHQVFILGLDGNWYGWTGKDFGQEPVPSPLTNAFFVAPGGDDTASGSSAAPFLSVGRCQAGMQASPTIKTCVVRGAATGVYDLSTCSISLGAADNGENWQGVGSPVLDGGGKNASPFILAGGTGIAVNGFSAQNFTGPLVGN